MKVNKKIFYEVAKKNIQGYTFKLWEDNKKGEEYQIVSDIENNIIAIDWENIDIWMGEELLFNVKLNKWTFIDEIIS